jgi:hypothetical protein
VYSISEWAARHQLESLENWMKDFRIDEEDLAILLYPEIREYDLLTDKELENPYCGISVHGRSQRYLSKESLGGYRFNSEVRYDDISPQEFIDDVYPIHIKVFKSGLTEAEIRYPVFD